MAAVDWPIYAPASRRAETPTRRGDPDRLRTVRADFLLDPRHRLTEQERALMTGMLADLVAGVGDELRAAAGLQTGPSGDDGSALFERLMHSRLIDIPDLIALVLRRAEQERIAARLAPRQAPDRTRFLHRLAASGDPAVAAAAMAMILGRSRRRDRFDSPRIVLDDVPAAAAASLVQAVAAAVRVEDGARAADDRLAEAARTVTARHDRSRSLEALAGGLVDALQSADQFDDEAIRAAVADGELQILAEAVARRSAIDANIAWSHFSVGGVALARLLRAAAIGRPVAAELAVAIGEGTGHHPADLIVLYDSLTAEQVDQARAWLQLDPHYRDAVFALGGSRGDSAD